MQGKERQWGGENGEAWRGWWGVGLKRTPNRNAAAATAKRSGRPGPSPGGGTVPEPGRLETPQ